MSGAPREPAAQAGLRLPGPFAPFTAMVGAEPSAQSLVAPVCLLPLLAQAQAQQLNLPALLRGLEIDPADLDMPGLVISHRDAITVVRRTLQLLPLADQGLALGQRARITERGALALGQLAAATLGDAIGLSLRFAQSAGHLMHLHDEPDAHGRWLVAEPFTGDQDLQYFLADLSFATVVQLRRQITAARYLPSRVELVRPTPAQPHAYAVFFGCPVYFGCLRNALLSSAEWLAFPLPWAQGMAYRLSVQLLMQESDRFNAMPALGFSVERAIRRHLPAIADLAQVARSLNLSERTLRRQLAQWGLSYRQLLDDSRRARAFDLMTGGRLPMADIAAAAGFSDPRAFTRAFKRWTGRPPSQMRALVGAAQPEPPLAAD